MNIIKKSENLSSRETYRMTHCSDAVSVKDAGGTVCKVESFVLYETMDKPFLAFADAEGTTYVTTSPAFIDTFEDIANAMPVEDETIKIVSRTSKSGRTYSICELA